MDVYDNLKEFVVMENIESLNEFEQQVLKVGQAC
jgi:hypothetical protein